MAAIEHWYETAHQQHTAGDLAGAEPLYRCVLAQQPRHVQALYLLGSLLTQQERYADALPLFERTLALQPQFVEAINNKGVVLREMGRLDEAEDAFRETLTAQPDYWKAANNLGMAALTRGDFPQALRCFDQVTARQPSFPQGFHNRAVALKELGRYDEALRDFYSAVQLQPDAAEAHSHLGTCLVAAGRLAEAHISFDKALTLDPEDAHAHGARALGLLVGGDFAEGWREYEWRFRSDCVKANYASKPRWDGAPLEGRTILIHAEQGFGDTLNFMRYLPMVKARGGRVLFECQSALESLLEDYDGVDALFDGKEAFAVQAPLLSLPGIFGTTLETVPTNLPQPQAPWDIAEAWRARLTVIAESVPAQLKVGLVWAGSPTHKNDHNRSCTLQSFAPLAQIPGIVFYSLQKGPAADQASDAPAGMTLVDLGPVLADFADTAAVIEQLDLIISVDTSVVHLAGALGKPVWTLVPFCPDWRWQLDREDSPWYPTMRLFRQPIPREWESVITRVADELAQAAAQSAPSQADVWVHQGRP